MFGKMMYYDKKTIDEYKAIIPESVYLVILEFLDVYETSVLIMGEFTKDSIEQWRKINQLIEETKVLETMEAMIDFRN